MDSNPNEHELPRIPTEDDWRSEPWGLDTPHAYRHFFGKTNAEAVKLFEENSLVYQEDVMFMPGRAFLYYVRAYCEYLLSDASRGDSDGASAFLGVIKIRAQQQPEYVRQSWSAIEPVLARLAEQQNFYDADWIVYGEFRKQISEIVEHGFSVSFDINLPEVVPAAATLAAMKGMIRVCSAEAGVQVLRNSGIVGITETSTRADVIRVLGKPDAQGGGPHPQFGVIPDWIRYHRPECSLRIGFRDDRISDFVFE